MPKGRGRAWGSARLASIPGSPWPPQELRTWCLYGSIIDDVDTVPHMLLGTQQGRSCHRPPVLPTRVPQSPRWLYDKT